MDTNFFEKTKIVATVGPASNSKQMLLALVREGVDAFRLNFSHGTHENHQKVINYVREINAEYDKTIALIQDLQGPKIRIQDMEPNIVISPGQEITITTDPVRGNHQRISTSYKNLPSDVKLLDRILIDDGKIELQVIVVQKDDVLCRVIHGGLLQSRKGINLPNTKLSVHPLTEKDLVDLNFGIDNEIDWIALSFVRTVDDITSLRNILNERKSYARIIAKIEKPEALQNIDEIIKATDGLMIARGDMGVEILMEEVPMVQKKLIEKCNQAAKPVIVATQMMESMIENPRPTRAETNDIANAVMDGADALMLSAETALGKYPIEVIHSMNRTIRSVEKNGQPFFRYRLVEPNSPTELHDNLILTACKLTQEVKASVIVCMTQIGYNAYRTASHRPNATILAITSNRQAINSVNLIWGTQAYYYDKTDSTDETISDIEALLKEKKIVKPGDIFAFLASMPISEKGRTNMLKIHVVK